RSDVAPRRTTAWPSRGRSPSFSTTRSGARPSSRRTITSSRSSPRSWPTRATSTSRCGRRATRSSSCTGSSRAVATGPTAFTWGSARAGVVALGVAACGTSRSGDQARGGEPSSGPPDQEPPVALNGDSPIQYPPRLYDQKVEGDVMLRLFVDSTGRLASESSRVAESSGYPALDSAALSGSRRLRFTPARRHGLSIGTPFLQPLEFYYPQAG